MTADIEATRAHLALHRVTLTQPAPAEAATDIGADQGDGDAALEMLGGVIVAAVIVGAVLAFVGKCLGVL